MKLRRVFGVVALAAGVFAARGAAQDAVTFKFADPKAGDRVRVTEDETSTITTSFVVQGAPKSKEEKSTKVLVYVEECVTAPEAAGKKPLKATRTYEKIEGAKDGKPLDAGLVGKPILIEKQGAKYTFTVNGAALTGPLAAELEASYNKPDGTTAKDLFPTTPLKVGDSWKVDTKKALAGLANDKMTFDPAKATMTGTLTKAYTKDGAQYGVFVLKSSMPITGLGPKDSLTIKPGSVMLTTVTGDGCIDGTNPVGDTTTKMQLKIVGSTKGVDVTVVADVDQKKKTVPVK